MNRDIPFIIRVKCGPCEHFNEEKGKCTHGLHWRYNGHFDCWGYGLSGYLEQKKRWDNLPEDALEWAKKQEFKYYHILRVEEDHVLFHGGFRFYFKN